MTDNAGLKGAAQIATEQVASTKNVRIRSDIVERAHDIEKFETWEDLTGLIAELADEIERLRTQVHDLTEAVNIEYVGSVAQARNAALEEAEKAIDAAFAKWIGDPSDDRPNEQAVVWDTFRALKGGE